MILKYLADTTKKFLAKKQNFVTKSIQEIQTVHKIKILSLTLSDRINFGGKLKHILSLIFHFS